MSTDAATIVAVFPSVTTGPGDGVPLPDEAVRWLVRTVVETHLHLPGMFELTFADATGTALRSSGLSIGTVVQVWGRAAGGTESARLIFGEVTAIEGRYEGFAGYTVVRGYDLSHRLQRARHTGTFMNMTDSDIASKIAGAAGLTVGEIEPTTAVHAHLSQCDQTDWDFLKARSREIGYQFMMSGEKFCFQKASSTSGGEPVPLNRLEGLWRFAPRVSAGNLAPEVEVRVWDPLAATVVTATRATATQAAALTGEPPAALGSRFVRSEEEEGGKPAPAGAGDLGPPPLPTAHVISNRPAGAGATADSAASAVAGGLSEHLASTFAEAEGESAGDPRIQAGSVVRIGEVPEPFTGDWAVTSATHIFDLAERGYVTRFVVSGRQERSLLGLASVGATQAPPRPMPGVVCGIVTNTSDTEARGRVKVTLPWLSPEYESDWAPVIQFGAGKRSGAMFLPEVGDEVLIGFEFGDPRRPYVLGGVVNAHTLYSLGGPAVQAAGETGQVVRRGFVSASGNLLVFYDDMPPGDGAKPTVSEITLGTADGMYSFAIDAVAGTLSITCSPESPPGHLTIQCGQGGTVDIKTGAGGMVNVDGGDSLSVKAQGSVTIESSGEVSIKGSKITLN